MSTIAYVYCMGNVAGPGFLNGDTGTSSVNLQPNANGGGAFSGTVWALTPTGAPSTYTFHCQGTQPGNVYLFGDGNHQVVGLSVAAGGSSTQWILAPVASSQPQQYTLQLVDTSFGTFYLNGMTKEGALNLVTDETLSGANWLVLDSFAG